MRIDTYQVFDQIISGTGTTWFSGSEFHRSLGQGDVLVLQAYPTNVPNTTSKLSVAWDYSADSQNWISFTAPDLTNATMANNVPMVASNNGFFLPGAFVRVNISLTGVSPSCRLKVNVTTRARSLKG